jgi:murein tripeptide amidase MpaA
MRASWFGVVLSGAMVWAMLAVSSAWSQEGVGPAAGFYAERYEGDRAVRVTPTTQRELRAVLGLSRVVLSERVGVGRRPVDVVVSPEAFEALVGMGLEVEVLIEDVQGAIDAERAEIERRRRLRDLTWYENYHPLEDIYLYIDGLVADHPGLASSEVVGQSIQGRDIVAMRITGPGDPGGRAQVVINACQHAREWVSPPTVLFAAESLLNGYGTDQRITDLMDRVEFIVLPMVNPDGYRYTWTNYRLWRKNRRNNGNGTYGVDLNRNWSYAWGGSGSSGNSSSDIYRGPSPFSEPETSLVADYIEALPRGAAHIDFHSFSQLILYPWGYTYSDAPEPDRTAFEGLAVNMSVEIQGVHGQYYVPQPASDLYIADGIMSDWSYGEAGMWGFTIELRPNSGSGYQFELPPDQIIPTAQENVPAVLELAEFVAYPLRFAFPEGRPGVVEAGESERVVVSVRATTGQVDASSVTLHARVGDNSFQASPMVFVGQDAYEGYLPAASCGGEIEWFLTARTIGGDEDAFPRSGADAPLSARALEYVAGFFDDAEADNGWTVGAPDDDATRGIWNRMDPEGTAAQPEDDHTPPPGTDCWVTDGRAGGSLGAYDVDDGTTTLFSPVFDATGGLDEPVAVFGYWRWYSNDQGNAPNEDSMPVEVSFDGGDSWTELELVTENANAWVYREFVLNDFGTPTSQTQVRFRARDLGQGSIVEAAVDDVELRVYGCQYRPGDYNRDGRVDTLDVLDFLNDWAAGDDKADWNHDGEVNTRDVTAFLNDWVLG